MTIKTKAQLNTNLPDNSVHSIDATNIRDIVNASCSASVPTANQVLKYNSGTDQYEPVDIYPIGTIVEFAGTIAAALTAYAPYGTWHVCDGTSGTKDKRDRMSVGANSDQSGVAKTNISGSFTTTGGAASASFAFHGSTNGTTNCDGTQSGTDNSSSQCGSNDSFDGNTVSASILNPYVCCVYIQRIS